MIALLQAVQAATPIPAEPPIGGILWALVVPALLFLVTAGGTWALYRKFEREQH